jgi:hypothetical protein
MAAEEELDRGSVKDNSVKAQAEHYLQMIEDDMNEHMEVALPGLSDDERWVNELHLVQSLYKDEGSGPSW